LKGFFLKIADYYSKGHQKPSFLIELTQKIAEVAESVIKIKTIEKSDLFGNM